MGQDILREFFLGFVKIHILHHAAKTGFYGVEMIDEMARHGYRLGPGTLYPTLHAMEREGYLRKSIRVQNGRRRIYYSATAKGTRLVRSAQDRIKELVSEVVESY